MIKNGEVQERVLIAVPAYNEEGTVRQVIDGLRDALPKFDLLVVDDGSTDGTASILDRLGVATERHTVNLGYGRAIQTALGYASRGGYDKLITVDADGQHPPEEVIALYKASLDRADDLLIGSRFIESRDYSDAPFGRRTGMRLFSLLARIFTGRKVYDTTSGLRIIRRSVFDPLMRFRFIDLHAEAIVYLLRLGYQVGEYPISIKDRTRGNSMYSFPSYFTYPVKTAFHMLLGLFQAELIKRR